MKIGLNITMLYYTLMLTPYEVIAKASLPAIRCLLARELIYRYNYTQKEVAKLMNVTQATISYYLSLERGKYTKILENTYIMRMIQDLARKLANRSISQSEFLCELNKIILEIARSGILCKYHEVLEPSISSTKCKICIDLFRNLQ